LLIISTNSDSTAVTIGGMNFVAPAVLITKIRKRVNIEKLHKIHG